MRGWSVGSMSRPFRSTRVSRTLNPPSSIYSAARCRLPSIDQPAHRQPRKNHPANPSHPSSITHAPPLPLSIIHHTHTHTTPSHPSSSRCWAAPRPAGPSSSSPSASRASRPSPRRRPPRLPRLRRGRKMRARATCCSPRVGGVGGLDHACHG